MDVLSEVMEGVTIRGSVFCHGEVRAPWCLYGGTEGTCLFHVVVDGEAIGWVDDAEAVTLRRGDLMLLTRGRQHWVGSGRDAPPMPLWRSVEPEDSGFARLTSGGDGAPATLICGTFDMSEMQTHPLLRALPDVMVVRGHDSDWLLATLTALDAQINTGALGSFAVVNRLAEILFVQAIAAWVETAEADHGWIRGLGDANVGRALARIHSSPGESLNIDSLAQTAGMSRSSFYRRFTELLGEPPATYLRQWRMALAARWLNDTQRTLEQISGELGYSGLPAFSRAFKADFGVPPSEFRRSLLEQQLGAGE